MSLRYICTGSEAFAPSGKATVGVVEARAGANAARAAIDPVIEAVNVTAIDAILVASDDDLYRNLLLLLVQLAVIADVIQVGLLVDLEIGVDAIIRHDRSKHRRRGGRGANQVADRDFGPVNAARDRRLDVSVVKIDLR